MDTRHVCYCRCICHTSAHEFLKLIEKHGIVKLPLMGRIIHGVEALNGECGDCVRECNHADVVREERDPVTPELAAENASPDPMADWSENERAYAFGDR